MFAVRFFCPFLPSFECPMVWKSLLQGFGGVRVGLLRS
jgi:hypothetical protein